MNPTRNHEVVGLIPGLAHWVKDPEVLWALVWVTDTACIPRCCGSGVGQRLQLQLDPQPGNLHMLQVWPLKDKKKKKRKKKKITLVGVPWWPSGYGFGIVTTVAQVQSLAQELLQMQPKWKIHRSGLWEISLLGIFCFFFFSFPSSLIIALLT